MSGVAYQDDFSWRERWAAQPLWFTFLYLAVLGGALFALWTWVAAPEEEMRTPGVAALSGAAFGLLFGAVMALVRRSVWQKSGLAELDGHARLVVIQALYTGRLPDDPSLHSRLRRPVAYHLEQERKSRRSVPVVYGLLLFIAVFNMWTVSLWFVLLGVWAVALGVYAWFSSARSVVRQHIANWGVGIVNVVVLGLIFLGSGLYADACLQIVYVLLGLCVAGLRAWRGDLAGRSGAPVAA